MDAMNDAQRQALEQLREITNGADDEVAVGVLSSVDWDVERAAELIFGGGTTGFARFEVDDSMQGRQSSTSPVPFQIPPSNRVTPPMMSLLAYPFHIISSIFRFIFNLLRIPFPRFMGLNFYRPLIPRPTLRRGPDKWLRELEEETGAISISLSKLPRATTSSINTDPGQSSLTSRSNVANGSSEEGRRYLPDFSICSYEELLRNCQRDSKIACVILVSQEHDDIADFKRVTLTDSNFVKTLYENGILVWGGDVRDHDAWSAAEKLEATTFPFVAFLALQPRRHPTSSSSARSDPSPSLTVLSRHQGKSTPSNASTSAQTLVDHIENQILPRVTPYLNRIIEQQRERERERHLRDEQDRAFQSAAKRDKERIEAKLEAERANLVAKQKAEEEARLASQRKAREAELARQRACDRMEWRRWTRRTIVNDPSPGNSTPKTLRIAFRLPNGGRVVNSFSPNSSLTCLYAFVDSQFIPAMLSASDDPAFLSDQVGTSERALEEQILKMNSSDEYWGFRISLAYPRMEIPWKQGAKLSDIEQLKGGGQVVVETICTGRQKLPQNGEVGGDDDGYHTEDSE